MRELLAIASLPFAVPWFAEGGEPGAGGSAYLFLLRADESECYQNVVSLATNKNRIL
jgi:hypothetical protein